MNAGEEPSVVANKVRKGKGDFGFNARTGEYKPLIAAGVLDPAKVAITAFLNAASIAALLLTTDCLVAEKKAETPGSARSSAPEKMDETF